MYERSHRDDRVAVKELDKLRAYQIEELNRITLQSLYSTDGSVLWVWQGVQLHLPNVSAFTVQLSRICDRVYDQTPVYRNELVNRHRLSSAINSPRAIFFKALAERWQEADLGFPNDKYPPERTIYLTLLKQTGIHRRANARARRRGIAWSLPIISWMHRPIHRLRRSGRPVWAF